MPISFDGEEINNITFNGQEANRATLNGTIVWQRLAARSITVASVTQVTDTTTSTVSVSASTVGFVGFGSGLNTVRSISYLLPGHNRTQEEFDSVFARQAQGGSGGPTGEITGSSDTSGTLDNLTFETSFENLDENTDYTFGIVFFYTLGGGLIRQPAQGTTTSNITTDSQQENLFTLADAGISFSVNIAGIVSLSLSAGTFSGVNFSNGQDLGRSGTGEIHTLSGFVIAPSVDGDGAAYDNAGDNITIVNISASQAANILTWNEAAWTGARYTGVSGNGLAPSGGSIGNASGRTFISGPTPNNSGATRSASISYQVGRPAATSTTSYSPANFLLTHSVTQLANTATVTLLSVVAGNTSATVNWSTSGATASSATLYWSFTESTAAGLIASGTSVSVTPGTNVNTVVSYSGQFTVRTFYAIIVATNAGGASQSSVGSDTAEALSIQPNTVTTGSSSSIGQTSALLSGTLTMGAGNSITTTGFIYSTSLSDLNTARSNTRGEWPSSIQNSVRTPDSFGGFSGTIVNLNAGTEYHWSTYTINPTGHDYGSVASFTTEEMISVVLTVTGAIELDRDGEELDNNVSIVATGATGTPTLSNFTSWINEGSIGIGGISSPFGIFVGPLAADLFTGPGASRNGSFTVSYGGMTETVRVRQLSSI